MTHRIRRWLVSLLADAIAEANKRHSVVVTLDGHAVDLALTKERRRRGRSA